jgi:hypothetical protein
MHSFEKYALLNDTLRDAQYEAFRAQTFAAGLKVLRAKRPPLPWLAPLALAASVLLLLGLALTLVPHRNPELAHVETEHSGVVSFSTRPLERNEVVHSSSDPHLYISTDPSTARFETVTTIHLLPPELNDRELFAFFGQRATGLVRLGDRTEFILLNN